jgi:hypothetical protein
MYPSKKRRLASLAAAGALAIAGAATALVATALPAAAVTICEQFGTVDSSGYVIMNNAWGTSATHCINTTSTGFQITQQNGMGNTSGAPASYPAIYLGCHYTRCSQNTALPRQINTIGSAPAQVSLTFPGSGNWDAAFDIWMNVDNNVSGVQDTEIMIWLNRQGNIEPIGGDPVATANIAGRNWEVWIGNNGQNNVVSYLFQGSALSSFNADVMEFVRDTLSRGSQYGNNNWWLTSIQMGFEPWIGGVGLTVNSFSQTINTGNNNQPPGTPGNPSCTTTSNSVSLNWGASSGTVSQYLIDRATGAGSTSFSQIGTSTGTSFNDGGRAANTTYRYRVRAQNQFGTSGNSAIVDCVTGGGTQVPGTPGTPTCTTTSNSVSLNWAASSGTVSQYLIERAQGATSTSFSQIATSTSTSLVDGGRAANTAYRYRVRAQNSAGMSGYSGITNCTTTGGQTTSTPPPPGGCTATYVTTGSWSGGFQGAITVRNTSSNTITSWRITFSLGGATINNFWGGRASGSSYINEPWNGTLTPNATATFGFTANGSPPGSVTVTCTTPA